MVLHNVVLVSGLMQNLIEREYLSRILFCPRLSTTTTPRFRLLRRPLCSKRPSTSLSSKSTRSRKLSHLLPNPAKNHSAIVDEARLRSVLLSVEVLPCKCCGLCSGQKCGIDHCAIFFFSHVTSNMLKTDAFSAC